MTKQKLLQAANQKNYKVEFSNNGFIDIIGIYKGKNCWHWFQIFDNGDVFFDHTYSQNTGKVMKGISHRIQVQKSLGFYN